MRRHVIVNFRAPDVYRKNPRDNQRKAAHVQGVRNKKDSSLLNNTPDTRRDHRCVFKILTENYF